MSDQRYTVDFFEALLDVDPGAFLLACHGLVKTDRFKPLAIALDVLLQPQRDKDLISNLLGSELDVSKGRYAVPEKMTFSSVFCEALRPLGSVVAPWTADQELVFSKLGALIGNQNLDLYKRSMWFEHACNHVQEPRAFNLFVPPMDPAHVANENPWIEALKAGNLVAAHSLVNKMPKPSDLNLGDENTPASFAKQSMGKGLTRIGRHLEEHAGFGPRQVPFEAMLENLPLPTRLKLAAYTAASYAMSSMKQKDFSVQKKSGQHGWNLESINRILRVFDTEAAQGQRPNFDAPALLPAALATHCAPLIQALGPSLKDAEKLDGFSSMLSNTPYVSFANEHTYLVEESFSPDRFEQTLRCLKSIEVHPKQSNGYRSTLFDHLELPLHAVAKEEDTETRHLKHMILVKMGVDPKEKDDRGWTPLSHVKGEKAKAAWAAADKVHDAHKHVQDIVNSLLPEGPEKTAFSP